MPLFGQLDLQAVLPALPDMPDLDTEPWELPGAQLLYLAFEVEAGVVDPLLPKALHPAVPRYVTVLVTQYPESPVGPFRLAQLRLMARAGVHPRGYVVHAYSNQARATAELRRRWGFPVETAADIRLRVHHDRIKATVDAGGRSLLDCALTHYEVVAGTDINYISSVHLAQIGSGKHAGARLVQVDPRYTIHKAERGRPELSTLAADAWGVSGFRVVHAVIGTYTTVDTDLPRIRFIMDPELPVIHGTTRVRESRE
jgi:hypothetical protein